MNLHHLCVFKRMSGDKSLHEVDQLIADTSPTYSISIHEVGQLNVNNTVTGLVSFSSLYTYEHRSRTELLDLQVNYTSNATANYNATIRTYFDYYLPHSNKRHISCSIDYTGGDGSRKQMQHILPYLYTCEGGEQYGYA